MKDLYLISYSVKGIKSLDQWVHLSFYKKTITKDFSIRNYNIKGIYGTNGAGKSGIVTSVKILKSLLIDESYLSNPLVQEQLDQIVNKRTGKLEFETEFIINFEDGLMRYKYHIQIGKNNVNKWSVLGESLYSRKATSHNDRMDLMFQVINSEIKDFAIEKDKAESIIEQTKNLLSGASLCALSTARMKIDKQNIKLMVESGIVILFLFGMSLFVYLDIEEDHTDYFINKMMINIESDSEHMDEVLDMVKHGAQLKKQQPFLMSVTSMLIPYDQFSDFEKQVTELEAFLKIFKKDLSGIEIEKKQDKNGFRCELVMVYEDYSLSAEFESTGIKKLIRLFAYLQKMAEGDIVFIDELDSNLHDVYLCALLEHLMEHGDGQLCFTTHNIGPMDVLKHNKNSIDFLSVNRKIYSWTTSGNYSPSKLYRNGMIEGSPFNVDAFDFMGVFHHEGGE